MTGRSDRAKTLLETAQELEKVVIGDLGPEKGIYPNVDFYSGLVYSCLGIPTYLFTPTFAVCTRSGLDGSGTGIHEEQPDLPAPGHLYGQAEQAVRAPG